ncbi:MAG: dihydrofolate reductase family protein, partial [Actinobacteria bacterium]|nr:dihydrofolate reductase family protein [Actinomycetota bacterium]
KLRAYVKQDGGLDTLEANLELGLPVDARTYDDAASVLQALRVRSVRLLTNNPEKVHGLARGGVDVVGVEPLPTAAHTRNARYLHTKQRELGHRQPAGDVVVDGNVPPAGAVDVGALVGEVRPRADRPYVVLKFAQTLDGRIATSTGDARWISGEAERTISHAMRAACDAVLVGAGTVLQDDPQLTVRMVDGVSPQRVVLDSTLRISDEAKILGPDAPTSIITTERSDARRRDELKARGVRVDVVAAGPQGVDLTAALRRLVDRGVQSLLVEGGSKVITGLLAAGCADRLVVSLAPTIIGTGTDAVGGLGVTSVAEGVRLVDRTVHLVENDVVIAGNIEH